MLLRTLLIITGTYLLTIIRSALFHVYEITNIFQRLIPIDTNKFLHLPSPEKATQSDFPYFFIHIMFLFIMFKYLLDITWIRNTFVIGFVILIKIEFF